MVEVLLVTPQDNKVEVVVELEDIVEMVELVVPIILEFMFPQLVLAVVVEEEDPTLLEQVKMVEGLDY